MMSFETTNGNSLACGSRYKIRYVDTNLSLFGIEAAKAIEEVLTGALVENVESETLDCKEDPSRRGPHGQILKGLGESDDAARIVADSASCLSNQHGGAVVVGLDDKQRGEAALIGTSLDGRWLRERVRELTVPPLHVSVAE